MTDAHKLGLFFGSFDPVHNGHLSVIEQAFERGACDQIRLVVQPWNAYKSAEPLATLADRVQMARLATSGRANIEVSSLDQDVPVEHSIVYTLDKLKQQNPSRELILLLGRDLVTRMTDWPDYEQIISMCRVFEAPRATKDVSSSQIRDLIKRKLPTDQLLPPSVADYIINRNLY